MIQTVSLTGAKFNDWKPGTAPFFTYDPDTDLWKLRGVEMEAGDEFKITFYEGWNDALGGARLSDTYYEPISPATPTRTILSNNSAGVKSDNFQVTQGGTYDITLDFSTYSNVIVLEPSTAP